MPRRRRRPTSLWLAPEARRQLPASGSATAGWGQCRDGRPGFAPRLVELKAIRNSLPSTVAGRIDWRRPIVRGHVRCLPRCDCCPRRTQQWGRGRIRLHEFRPPSSPWGIGSAVSRHGHLTKRQRKRCPCGRRWEDVSVLWWVLEPRGATAARVCSTRATDQSQRSILLRRRG